MSFNQISIYDHEVGTEVQFCPYGEYCHIPLESNGLYEIHPLSAEEALSIIENQYRNNSIPTPFTHGHHGEREHSWHFVGYEVFSRADGVRHLIHLYFEPDNPELFV